MKLLYFAFAEKIINKERRSIPLNDSHFDEWLKKRNYCRFTKKNESLVIGLIYNKKNMPELC